MRLLMSHAAHQAAEADRRQAGLADTLVALLLAGSLAAAALNISFYEDCFVKAL